MDSQGLGGASSPLVSEWTSLGRPVHCAGRFGTLRYLRSASQFCVPQVRGDALPPAEDAAVHICCP